MPEFDIARRRLHNQGISATRFSKPEEVVAWLGAVQAQDYAGAKWALGLRLSGARDDLIDQAFASGAILRTHLLRPTWHFVTPVDIRWLLALTAPRVHATNGSMYRQLELGPATLQKSQEVLARVLQAGQALTRDELRTALQASGIDAGDGQRLAYILMSAELEGVICSGPRRGKQFTYALLEERAPQALNLGREPALAELARRYFLSRGPATVHDFAKWSGLTVTDARRGLESVQNQLEHTTVDGQTLWFPPSPPAVKATYPAVYLLSTWDEYISGYQDRRAIHSPEVEARLKAMGNALRYIIVIDGQIVGTWRRTLHKLTVRIEASLFRSLAAAEEQAFAGAAQRYGDFLGLAVEVMSKPG